MSLLSIKKKLSCNRRLFYDCLLAGLLTCLVFIALSIVLKVYPFGDNTFLYSDSDQNISFVSYFANSFTSNNNLLYSWSGAFGGSVICTIAYYTSSPFNLFMLLFQNNFLLGYYFSTIAGFIFAAINFCLCIEYIHHGKKRIGIICFSVCYAFIGYTVTYIWSTPWMVGVAFLPLMMLGLLKIINENKSGIFVISSTLSLVGNFYTGYMNLLAVCIFFVGLMFTQRGFRDRIKCLPKFIFSVLTSIGLSAFILLPVWQNLPSSRKIMFSDLWNENTSIFNFLSLLEKFYSGSISIAQMYEGLPIIFFGLIPMVLVIVFYFNRKVSIRIKIVTLSFFVIMIICFNSTFLTSIWHGFSYNICFNYRYSYVFSFVGIVVAYLSYCELPKQKLEYLCAGLVSMFLAFVTFQNSSYMNTDFNRKLFVIDNIIILVTIALCWLSSNSKTCAIQIIILIIAIMNIGENAYLSTYFGVKARSASSIDSQFETYKQLKKYLPADEMYRFEEENHWGRCDGMLLGYASLSDFSSSESNLSNKLADMFGIWQSGNSIQYMKQVPIGTDSVLGIKYLAGDCSNIKGYNLVTETKGTCLFENPYALPIVVKADSFGEIGANNNTFDNINQIFSSLHEFGENIYDRVGATVVSANAQTIIESYQSDRNAAVYTILPKNVSISSLTVNDVNIEIPSVYYPSTAFYLYDGKSGDKVIITYSIETDDVSLSNIPLYYENKEALKSTASYFKKQNISVKQISSSEITASFSSTQDAQIVVTTIPFDESWNIKIDEKNSNTVKNWNGFLSFYVNKGEHLVIMNYYPKGMKLGLIISITTLVILIVYFALKKSNKN